MTDVEEQASAAVAARGDDNKLSVVSKQYDRGAKGYLDPTEQVRRREQRADLACRSTCLRQFIFPSYLRFQGESNLSQGLILRLILVLTTGWSSDLNVSFHDDHVSDSSFFPFSLSLILLPTAIHRNSAPWTRRTKASSISTSCTD